MTQKTLGKYLMLTGASAIALGWLTPAAIAQEDTDVQRKLGTVLVTTQKTEESIQDVPIAVSAFDEDALEKLQLAGGPDLVKSIPNVNFTKGNFSGYNFRIRGIGVDAVSTSADAGVGVHQNDVPLTSNALFEAEFYDVERVEVLRGPQGTLYGRNATGGVFNLITAKPVLEEFQADAKLTYGNYNTVKAKGMINVPLGDKAAFRLAGSMLQRDGYVDNVTTGNDVDDRDLYSIRASLAFEPTDRLRTFLSYEHFEEDDNRIRSGKQFCAKDPNKTSFAGISISAFDQLITSQGCVEARLSDPASLGGVNTAGTLGGQYGFISGTVGGIDPLTGNAINIDANTSGIIPDLRKTESYFDPTYEGSQDLFTWKAEFDITDSLLLTYLGSYNENEVISQEDYNEYAADVPFNTTVGPFIGLVDPALAPLYGLLFPGGVVQDPQLGAFNFPVAADLSGAYSEQTTHEIRLQSDFDGPFNFNLGAISVDFETNTGPKIQESYYVFFNASSAFNQILNAAQGAEVFPIEDINGAGATPIENLDGVSRQYFRSLTPYWLESFAVFGEGYYDINDDLKATLGLRYTKDDKEVLRVPTFLSESIADIPDPLAGTGKAQASFEEVTGRVGLDWSPELSWSEDSLFYAFYSRGYKGGGINPPQPAGSVSAFPELFDPEFINSYEVGTKNTLAGGALQLNATGFYYDYTGYQITQIINRTSANFNVDAEIKGLEIETIWNPASTFIINANLGLLDAQVKDTYGVDVLDRTNGRSDLVVLKQFPGAANCVVSAEGYATILGAIQAGTVPGVGPGATLGLCSGAFAGAETAFGVGTVTYTDSSGQTQTIGGLTPFEGDAKDLDGNNLPGTPDTTLNIGAEYTFEALGGGSWDMRLRGDYYYQADAFSRVWNTGRDELESWDNLNLSIQFINNDNGLEFEIFGKNITDEEVITGSYLTDDSSGLFSNVFLNEPALYGVSVTKRW
ncbi:TonB-dependent receptor [Henriciella litoralis]|uniref:TonB-dependent receptor n=1 Tax=Henriciella litoralis TaxID=568102 RepID=UPI001F21F467|nr:TonB-dependent receptor [Henriciella litoralis]